MRGVKDKANEKMIMMPSDVLMEFVKIGWDSVGHVLADKVRYTLHYSKYEFYCEYREAKFGPATGFVGFDEFVERYYKDQLVEMMDEKVQS